MNIEIWGTIRSVNNKKSSMVLTSVPKYLFLKGIISQSKGYILEVFSYTINQVGRLVS